MQIENIEKGENYTEKVYKRDTLFNMRNKFHIFKQLCMYRGIRIF